MNYVTYGTTLGIRDATWRVAQQRGGCQRCTQRLQRTPRQTFADISEEYPRLVGVRLGWFGSGEHRLLDETCQLAQRRGTALVIRGRQ